MSIERVKRGPSTLPWGELMLSVRGEERWRPSFTDWGRSVRKSLIQEQVSGGRPQSDSLMVRMSGLMVLKAEL